MIKIMTKLEIATRTQCCAYNGDLPYTLSYLGKKRYVGVHDAKNNQTVVWVEDEHGLIIEDSVLVIPVKKPKVRIYHSGLD